MECNFIQSDWQSYCYPCKCIQFFRYADLVKMQCTNKNPADIFTNSRMIFLFYRPQEQYHRIGIKSSDPVSRHNGLRITLEH